MRSAESGRGLGRLIASGRADLRDLNSRISTASPEAMRNALYYLAGYLGPPPADGGLEVSLLTPEAMRLSDRDAVELRAAAIERLLDSGSSSDVG